MESIEQEGGRRRRRSYDEAFKRDAVRLASEEKYLFKAVNVGGGRSNRAIPSASQNLLHHCDRGCQYASDAS